MTNHDEPALDERPSLLDGIELPPGTRVNVNGHAYRVGTDARMIDDSEEQEFTAEDAVAALRAVRRSRG